MLRRLFGLLLFLFCYVCTAQTVVSIVGNIAYVNNTPFNGTLQIALARTAMNTCTTPAQVVQNVSEVVTVSNGVVGSAPGFIPTACLQPSVPYYVQFIDSNNNNVGNANWYVSAEGTHTPNQMDVGDLVISNFGGPIVVSIPAPIVSNPSGSQTVTQPAGSSLAINNLSVTTLSGTTGSFSTLSIGSTLAFNSSGIDSSNNIPLNPNPSGGGVIDSGFMQAYSYTGSGGIPNVVLGSTTTVGTGASYSWLAGTVPDDFSGSLLLTTGTGISAIGSAVTITFGTPRSTIPNCVCSVQNVTTGMGVTDPFIMPWVASTNSIVIFANPVISNSTEYAITYLCGGK